MIHMQQTLLHDEIKYHQSVVEAFIRCAEKVPDEHWNTSRTPGTWTPSQEVTHLERTYREYVIELRRGPDVTPETFPPQREVFRVKILPRVLKGNWFPTGAVSPDPVKPDEISLEKAQQLTGLGKRVAEFENTIIEIASSHPERQVRHPYFGALGLIELSRVLAEHTRHHMKKLQPE